MLIVPTYFQWPFMADNDVQMTYVMTTYDARKQGWGEYLLRQGMQLFCREGRSVWYVTDTNNVASRKLAEKVGFVCVGKANPRSSKFQRVLPEFHDGLRRRSESKGATVKSVPPDQICILGILLFSP